MFNEDHEAYSQYRPQIERHFYIITDGSEFSGRPVEMSADELAAAQDHAETHSGGNWWWVRYDRDDEDMRHYVNSFREELQQDC